MSLQQLVSLADEIPWCGTVPLRPWPPHPPHFLPGGIKEPSNPRYSMFGPHPEPWDLANVRAGLSSSIRMFQFGQQIEGDTGRLMTSAAQEYFDDWCGTVPLSVLLQIILHGPPPPPDPWLDRLIYLANTVILAQLSDQEQLGTAANRQLIANLKAVQKQA